MEKLGEYHSVSIEVDGDIKSILPGSANLSVFHDVYDELRSKFPTCKRITVYYD